MKENPYPGGMKKNLLSSRRDIQLIPAMTLKSDYCCISHGDELELLKCLLFILQRTHNLLECVQHKEKCNMELRLQASPYVADWLL